MHNKRLHNKQQGFTLVEMAIVLVIIGIILAAVMKGRDLISSSEETRQEQSYFMKWLTITDDYYKAVKRPLGDGDKNGGLSGQGSDGYCDNIFGGRPNNFNTIFNATNTVGVDPCSLVKTNLNDLTQSAYACVDNLNPFQTMIDTDFAGKIRVYVGWCNYNLEFPDAAGTGTELRRKNVLAFFNVPVGYAKRLDSTIDGTVNGKAGKCLNLTENALTPSTNVNILGNGPVVSLTANPARLTTTTGLGGTAAISATTNYPYSWPTQASERGQLLTVGIVLDY